MSHRSSLERYDRRGLSIISIGGLLFTLDIPLLRLAAGDQWSMIFARGVLMALTITLAWLAYRWMRGNSEPFINGRAGLIVAATNTLANIMFISAVTKTAAGWTLSVCAMMRGTTRLSMIQSITVVVMTTINIYVSGSRPKGVGA